ncbi:ribosome maturation factor RimM [Oceaniglobus trochenteri]|uniref:ribosome maturation factor RimM n=1 Tax=Oceaniglobus trochenteri TaxID=2763260 RepID=UPI001CFF55E6|nr:ribosome maturation factor RimM [Oceaniglobus trochenteri]
MPKDDLICVGAVGGAFGVRGDVRLKSFCADPAAIAEYGPLTTEDGTRSFDITLTGAIKTGFSARLSGVETREEADALRNIRLFAPRDRLPSLPDDEYYHADLIGLPVHDTGGALIGKVQSVQNHGAADLLELKLPGVAETVLLPFTLANVPTVDLGAGRIVADPPEGLLP